MANFNHLGGSWSRYPRLGLDSRCSQFWPYVREGMGILAAGLALGGVMWLFLTGLSEAM